MKNKLLELSNELSEMILESEVFEGSIELRILEDGEFKLTLLHFHSYYRYSNTSIEVYNFSSEQGFEDFRNKAIDCIKNNTILNRWEVF